MKYIITALLFTLLTFSTDVQSQQINSEDQFKQEFLNTINRTRAKGCKCGTMRMRPAPPLVWNDQLEKAAIGHAQDMAIKNYFSHDSKDGRSSFDRVQNAGYTRDGYQSFAVGENIAQGQLSIAEVMAGWFKSEGHCRNLMNPDFKEVGVAEYNTYWVQDFGGRQAFSEEVQQMIKSGKVKIVQRPAP